MNKIVFSMMPTQQQQEWSLKEVQEILKYRHQKWSKTKKKTKNASKTSATFKPSCPPSSEETVVESSLSPEPAPAKNSSKSHIT